MFEREISKTLTCKLLQMVSATENPSYFFSTKAVLCLGRKKNVFIEIIIAIRIQVLLLAHLVTIVAEKKPKIAAMFLVKSANQ